MIETEIKRKEENNIPLPQYLEMVLVPVTPIRRQVSTTSVVSEVIQSNVLQSVSIYSGNNKTIPMKMEVVYSGF